MDRRAAPAVIAQRGRDGRHGAAGRRGEQGGGVSQAGGTGVSGWAGDCGEVCTLPAVVICVVVCAKMCRFSRDAARPTTPLDAIKFLCKDLWSLLFRKQIDNLKTNHRGIYVLTDNTFKPLTRMSFDTKKYDAAMQAQVVAATGDPALGRDANSLARVQPFLYFPAGVIRGCLESLGIKASVTAECAALPAATFQIRTAGAKN